MTLVQKIFRVTRWGVGILFVGLLTGAMVVIFPPMASIGVVALVGVVLLWALPELRLVREKQLRVMFFMMAFVLLCVPAYYAIQVPGLPWISFRRLFSFIVIMLFSITVASSKTARQKIKETLGSNQIFATLAIGFLVMLFLSIITASNRTQSITAFSDSLLNWYIPLFACILVVRSDKDVILLAKIIVVAGMIDASAGIAEFILRRRYYFDIFPAGMLSSMMADNPAVAAMVSMNMYRNGLYRAASIFTVSLSFGEFEAMVAPIAAYFVLHGARTRDRVLGVFAILLAVGGIFVSGARGAYISLLVTLPLMFFLWTIRFSKLNPSSLVGAISLSIISMSTVAIVGAVFFWQRLTNIVLGGGETVSSTEARIIQWNLAKPHIFANPFTGSGVGNAADVVGFYTDSPIPSIDSYVISVLVETGVPGFLFFFGMIACGFWIGLRIYLTDPDKQASLGAPLACSLAAFGIYRLALSQRESFTLFFLIIGLVFAIGKLAYERRKSPGYRPLWGVSPAISHAQHKPQPAMRRQRILP
jgi:O-antigen ligase